MRALAFSLACLGLPPALFAQTDEPPIREMVGFDQNTGTRLPVAATFTDANGKPVSLGDAIGGIPAVIVFGYFTCPQLCGITIDGTLDTLAQLEPSIGKDYSFIYISINPSDTPSAAAEKLAAYARRYGRSTGEKGWHFLTGGNQAIKEVTQAAGFRYQRLPGTREFAHASGFLLARPDGVIVRYFPGIDFRPAEVAESLRLAEDGGVGQRVFDLLLVCISGGLRPGIARWAFLSLQLACGLTVVALATGVGRMLRAEHRSACAAAPRKQEGKP